MEHHNIKKSEQLALLSLSDVTMTEGEMPNLLEGVTSDQDSILDYSIDNEYSFKTKGGLTSVDLV